MMDSTWRAVSRVSLSSSTPTVFCFRDLLFFFGGVSSSLSPFANLFIQSAAINRKPASLLCLACSYEVMNGTHNTLDLHNRWKYLFDWCSVQIMRIDTHTTHALDLHKKRVFNGRQNIASKLKEARAKIYWWNFKEVTKKFHAGAFVIGWWVRNDFYWMRAKNFEKLQKTRKKTRLWSSHSPRTRHKQERNTGNTNGRHFFQLARASYAILRILRFCPSEILSTRRLIKFLSQ